MTVEKTDIEGVVILHPRVFPDSRGYFFESFSERDFAAQVAPVHFVQDNESRSTRGVVRGLHYQKGEHAQAKLVRCVRGCVLDVAVDLRAGSPTYGRHVAVELTGEGHEMLQMREGWRNSMFMWHIRTDVRSVSLRRLDIITRCSVMVSSIS